MSSRCLSAFLIAVALFGLIAGSAFAGDAKRDALWSAVRAGDVKAIEAALASGADVNARNEIGVSALWIAASKGKLEPIELLVKRGADVNVRDGIWYMTPLSQSTSRIEVARLLIKAGAKDFDAALFAGASAGNEKTVKMILEERKPGQDALDACLYSATVAKNAKLQEMLKQAGAKPLPPVSEQDRKSWAKMVGTYESDGGAMILIALKDVGLVYNGRWLKPTGPDTFVPLGSEGAKLRIERQGDDVARVILTNFTAEYSFYRFKKPVVKPSASAEAGSGAVAAPLNWPSFRGPDGTGVADGQQPPIVWNAKTGDHICWKTPIPGLGHSCPVVWGNRIFVTTAISSGEPNPKIRIGNYGAVDSVKDDSKHTWQVLCLDRDSGQVLWTRTAYEGVPKIKRHLKGSQANCTPATDGRHVVACFGSEGLYCYDFAGKLLWKRDLSTLDSSFAIDQEYEWGFGNSPVIYEGLAILQCDLSRDSFIAAFNLDDGSKVWSTPRDEIPSWSSPVVWHNSQRDEIVTNAAQYARGYDPKTGAELWRLAKKSEVTIPAPVCGKDLLFITSGNRPIQPIFAIKPGAAGDISLKEDESTNSHILWSKMRGGPYMPTPILYGAYFYTCSNSGIVTCYEANTGKEVYKERMGSGSYTSSPVASDGRLYFTSEQGETRVVKAGPVFELLAVNSLDDYVMATAAISNGSLFIRSQHFLFSLGKKLDEKK
jgi:outer membrane protein assembly factor BamB